MRLKVEIIIVKLSFYQKSKGGSKMIKWIVIKYLQRKIKEQEMRIEWCEEFKEHQLSFTDLLTSAVSDRIIKHKDIKLNLENTIKILKEEDQ